MRPAYSSLEREHIQRRQARGISILALGGFRQLSQGLVRFLLLLQGRIEKTHGLSQTLLDEAVAMPLAQLLRREGLSVQAKEAETLSMSKLFALEIKGVALICLCFLEHATPAQLHYATRRLRRKAPGVSILASVFDETRQTPNSDPLQLQDAEFLQGPLSAGVSRISELISLAERRIENDQRPALATVK